MRVLLIDDNPGDLFLTQRAIEKVRPGTTVITSNGETTLLDPKPALVLLDLNMPVGGLEVLRGIKSDPKTRSIPVIVFSSSESARDVNQAYACYANGFVVKPLSNDVLERTMKAVLDFWLGVNQVAR